MTNVINFSDFSNSDETPFDKIRHLDESGKEFWRGRELMPLLGYDKWERFSSAIAKAIGACKNSGQNSNKHFFQEVGKSSGGRPAEDYRLSRFASYLTAMNGDSRKPEIAAAQSYFAVKTRQSEISDAVNPSAQIKTQPDSLKIAKALFAQMQQQQQVMFAMLQHQEEMAGRLNLVESQINTVQNTIASIEEDREDIEEAIASIQENQAQAEAELQKIDAPEVPIQQMSDRKKISWLVRAYVIKTNASYSDVWRNLYRHFSYRYSIDLIARASNETKKLRAQGKKGEVKPLDILERLGKCKEFYAVAYDVLINQAA